MLAGVLRSWAVPKGPSLDPREKRLAVQTEDHPAEYATFEGLIPADQYGGGPIMIWDRGQWNADGDARADLAAGLLKFRLHGERLRGRWMLVRTTTGTPDQPHWLLVKERDADAAAGVHAHTFGTSVVTGRTIEQIARGEPARTIAPVQPAPARAADLPGARAAPLPVRLAPQLATSAGAPPEGDDWLHEVKFDGYRLLISRDGGSEPGDPAIRILSRNGLDWTDRLPLLVAAIRERLAVDAMLDGEAVILDTRGVSDFQALQNALHGRRHGALIFFAFDLPWCDGFDLTRTPLEARRDLLASLIGTRQEGRVRLSEAVRGSGAAAFARARDHGLEGIVSKRLGSPYLSARTPSWLKVKAFEQQEFVIVGWSPPEGSREHLGALLLGCYDDRGVLRFAGRVGTGFSAESLRTLARTLASRIAADPPVIDPPKGPDAKGVVWARPDLVCQVQFRDWSRDGVVRHASFRGLCEDRDPKSVRREVVSAATPRVSGPAPAGEKAGSLLRPPPPAHAPSGVRLTNLDRVVFPAGEGHAAVTKRQVARYYEAVADRMLPHLAGRPLAIVRCPDGVQGPAFFQKHPGKGMPAGIHSVDVSASAPGGETEQHLMIDDVRGLLGLVQMSAIELHPWGARAVHVEEPDRLIFDLDPGEGVAWRTVADAAAMVKQALDQIGLRGFPRTSGGKGLHVVVPLAPGESWASVSGFARAAAQTLARLAPKRFVATVSKSARIGRVYVDHLRNVRGATAVCAYSLRARPGPAAAATPVGWAELPGLSGGNAFTLEAVLRRVTGSGDPWEGFEDAAGTLPRVAE
jgi:bifunctional non-homologous end joining protein LigD